MYFSTRDTSLTSPLKSLWYFPVMVHSCAAKITGKNLLHISKNWHEFLLKSKKKNILERLLEFWYRSSRAVTHNERQMFY